MPGVPGIQSYTSVAASNTTWFPEGMAPSAVNDGMRQVQADIRNWYADAEWINLGDTPSRASASTFKITGDVTTKYPVNSRIKLYDASTLYGVVTAISYAAPDTTVTVGTDSGSLTASLTSVARSIIMPSNLSIPSTIGRKGTDLASAATADLSTVTADFVDITGTTTITALGTVAAGVERTVRFTGALTLTHNSTSLILPGGVNITTTSGDTAVFRSLGSGNWLCISYKYASGGNTIVGIKGADIASAATVDLATATGDFVDVTGTTTITAFGTLAAGIERTVRFTGALTLTHNATSLILPGGANITTAANDTAIFRSLGSGNWVCISYTYASGIGQPATQADQETATSVSTYVTPGRQQYHPSAAKFWSSLTYVAGVPTVRTNGSYNVTSFTDNGTGDFSINLTTAFSSATANVIAASAGANAGGSVAIYPFTSNSGGSLAISTASASSVRCSTTAAGALADVANIMNVLGWGDQ